jgi:hypothetical protein
LMVIDGVGGGLHIHDQPLRAVGHQLYVVTGNRAALRVLPGG